MDISFTNVLEGARQYFAGLPAASNPTQRENDGSVHSEQHSAIPYWDQQQSTEQTMNTMNPTQPQTNRPQQNYYEKQQNYAYSGHQVLYQQQPHIPSSSSYYEVPNQPNQVIAQQVTYPVTQTSHHGNLANHGNHTNIGAQASHPSHSSHPNQLTHSNQVRDSNQITHSNQARDSNQVTHSDQGAHINHASHPNQVRDTNHGHQVRDSNQVNHPGQVSHSNQVNPLRQASHPNQVSHLNQAVRTGQVSHSNQASHPNQVSHANHPNQVSHSNHPNQVSHSNHPNQVSHSNQASHPTQASHGNQVSRPNQVSHGNQASHLNQVRDSNQVSHPNHVRDSNQATQGVQRQQNYGYHQNAAYPNYSSTTPSSSQAQEYNYNKMYNRNNTYQGGYYHHQHQPGAIGTTGTAGTTAATQRMHTGDLYQNNRLQYQNKPTVPVAPTSTSQRPMTHPINGASTSNTSNTSNPDYYKYYQNTNKYTNPSNTNQYSLPHHSYNVNQTKPAPVTPTKQGTTMTYAHLQQKNALAKQKRESPLDLSVKTVKTSADSTLDFEERNYRVMMQQYQTARAPKVDFLPNFNMPTTDSKAARGVYYPNYTNTGKNVPGTTTNNEVRVDSRESLPRIDFPAISRRTVLEPQGKRRLEPSTAEVPEKIAKIDTWRQNIDKQIEQRLSSYTKSRTEGDGTNGNYLKHSNYQYAYQSPPKKGTPKVMETNKHATKKVLNLLRNSLQIKGQKKMEQEHQHLMLKQNYREIQQPSTDVLAPLQPKPSILGRRNVSPFTAASLERNSATPSAAYKLHIPKAIDSVIFGETQDTQAQTANADLDGLAAYLAARTRTKAELKQVPSTPNSPIITNQLLNNNNNKESVIVANVACLSDNFNSRVIEANSAKKLFNRYDGMGLKEPRGDLRSSSETSVFDFPDSDNEAEIPVLGMRKDRKTLPSQFTGKAEDLEDERPVSPFDLMFNQTCDTFMEQLKNGCGKKRGRRKKMDESPSPEAENIEEILETNEPEENTNIIIKTEEVTIKIEDDIKIQDELSKIEEELTKIKEEIDIKIPEDFKIKEEVIIVKEEVIKKEDKIDQTSDSDTPLSNLIKTEKIEEHPHLPLSIYKPGKKPTFGDGSGFHPGWEMELYRYKKSLRMPRMLIQVTRPPNCTRLSTSLPDLDPSPSSPQSITGEDHRKKTEDSDIDSNCSFNFSITRTNYDSEEGSSSVKSLKSSISDKLLERYGARKKKRIKKQEEIAPKLIPKTETTLLATPSLEENSPIKTPPSILLGFRKKTIDDFKEAFSHTPINEFTTVVVNSRTRKETRVLKQKATIREVFGEDRPASAPPITCLEDVIKLNEKKPSNNFNQSLNDLFLKALSNKIIKTEINKEDKEDNHIKKEEEHVVILGSNKKKNKFRAIRRKLSSGFDYIRKKKKIKKEDFESDVTVKPKKRSALSKSNPESIQDIQKEIKVWVLNKGVGETHLHRASRLGFTDIAAYCLENMACNPSPRDNAGYTPLHEACSKGHLDIAKLLLQYGAHVSESAQGGIRPLHEAAENGFVEIVRLLLSFGADPTLATYSGITPLQLAVEDTTVNLLQQHISELQGKPSPPWYFNGPSNCFDPPDLGFDTLCETPEGDKPEQEQDLDIEVSEQMLPNLYYLPGHESERWVLLQDLANILKIKSKETLLRQLNVVSSNVNKSDIVKELKTVDFLEKARCCQFLNANEKLNTRSSKVYLVKYTEKVKSLLNVENVVINVR